MPKLIDLTGKKFHRLLVLRRGPDYASGGPRWYCLCGCGNQNETLVDGRDLRHNLIKSCGCLKREIIESQQKNGTKHGRYGSPEYRSWMSMVQRCTNPKNIAYQSYGGRGVIVCEEWKFFENFFKDMGRRPDMTTPDRIDNEKGYSKENCRWATSLEQRKNQRPKGPRRRRCPDCKQLPVPIGPDLFGEPLYDCPCGTGGKSLKEWNHKSRRR